MHVIEAIDLATQELFRARDLYPDWPQHLPSATLIAMEEAGEVAKAVNNYYYQQGDDTLDDIRKECIQTIAMFLRLLADTEELQG